MKHIKKIILPTTLLWVLFCFSLSAANIKTNTNNYGSVRVSTFETNRYEHSFSYNLEKLTVDGEKIKSKYAEEINKRLSRRYDAFLNSDVKEGYLEFNKAEENFIASYEYMYKTYLSFKDKNIITILEESYVYTGGANGMLYTEPLMFSLNSGKEISSITSTLIKNTKDNELIKILRKKLLEKGNKDLYFDFESITLPALFYVSDKEIVFSYGLYEIAPRVAGIIDITFTYEELKPFVKKNQDLDYLFE